MNVKKYALFYPTVEDFYGMYSMNAGAVKNLLPAGGSRSGDKCWCDAVGIVYGLAYGGEQHHLSDGKRGLVVFFLITERARHATAAAGDDVNGGVG